MTVDPANAARVLAAKVTTWADNELGYRRHRGLLDLDAANSVVAAALEPLAAEPMQSILCFLMERVIAEDKVRHIRQQLVLLLTHKAGPLEALGPSLLVEKHRHYTKLTDRIATLDSTMRTRLAQYSQLVDRIRKAEMKLAQTRAAANEHARRHRFKRCREQAIRQQINQHRQSTGRWEQQNPAKTPLHTIAECPSHSHTEALYRTLESKREALLRKQDSQGDAHHITALQIAQEILDTVSNREALHHLIAQAQAVASNLHTTAPAPRRPGNLILADAITKLAQLLHQLHQFHVQQHITNVKQASALLRVEQQVQTAQLQLNATLGSLLSNEAQRAAIQQELTHQAMVQAYHTRLELTDQIASQLNNTEAKTNVVDALTQQWSDYAIISRKAKASAILLRLKVKQLQVLLEDYLPRHAQSLAHQSITQQQAIAAKAAHQTQELLIVAGQWPKAVEQELIAFNQAHLLATTWLPSPVAGNRTLVLRSDYLVLERARQDQIYRQVTDVLQLPAELSPQASVYQLIQQSCRYFERAYCTRVSQALMASGQLKMKTLVGNHRPLEGTEQPPGQEGASDDALRDAFAAILHSLQVKADKLAHVRDTNLVPQLEQGLHVALVGTNEHQRAAAFKDGRCRWYCQRVLCTLVRVNRPISVYLCLYFCGYLCREMKSSGYQMLLQQNQPHLSQLRPLVFTHAYSFYRFPLLQRPSLAPSMGWLRAPIEARVAKKQCAGAMLLIEATNTSGDRGNERGGCTMNNWRCSKPLVAVVVRAAFPTLGDFPDTTREYLSVQLLVLMGILQAQSRWALG